MKWYQLDPENFNPKAFGLRKIDKIQGTTDYNEDEIIEFILDDWVVLAQFLDWNPITVKLTDNSQRWIFAAKGVKRYDLCV